MPRLYRPDLRWGGAVIAAISLLISIAPNTAQAATSSQGTVLTTSPISADITTAPGSSATTTLQVQNNSSRTLNINVTLEKFRASGNYGQAQIYKPPATDPSVSWVHFSQTSFTAVPNVWNTVTMTVDFPKTASFGYYYAVLFEPQNVTTTTRGNIIKGANAIFVLANAKVPGEKNTLQVKVFSSDKSVYQFIPAHFNITVHNAGNIYTVPQGDIFISRNPKGPSLATMPFNQGGGNILPGTDRIFETTWSDGVPSYVTKRVDGQIVSGKNGQPATYLDWSGSLSNFRFGKYYAHLVLVYNNGEADVPVNAIVSFWVIPWAILFGLLVVLALVIIGVWGLVKYVGKAARWVKQL